MATITDSQKNWIVVLIMAALLFNTFYTGSHAYPWIEDSDGWEHASAVQYILTFDNPMQPAPYTSSHYLLPYPPLYDMAMAALKTISGLTIPETLKTFNSLMCALAIPGFYLWSSTKFGNRIGLWSTFVITCLPSFMSHFIWSQSLAICLMFPAMYLFEKRSQWSVIAMGLVMVTQPSVAVIFAVIMCIYAVTDGLATRVPRLANETTAGGFQRGTRDPGRGTNGYKFVVLAIAWAFVFFWGPCFVTYGFDTVMKQISFNDIYTFPSQTYWLADFIDAPTTTLIDQPTGLGLGIFILAISGIWLAWKQKNLFLLALLAFCLIGLEASILPIKLLPHRFWVFLAIPVSILAGMAAANIIDRYPAYKIIAAIGIIILVILTGLAPKVQMETSVWTSPELPTAAFVQGYLNLPPGSQVYDFCAPEHIADGFGLKGRAWDPEAAAKNWSRDSAWLKLKGYQYAIIDQACTPTHSVDEVNQKLLFLSHDPGLNISVNLSINQTFYVFEVKQK